MRALRRVVATERGGTPGYSEWHVLEALKRMSSEPVGRLSLSSVLGIGEASARTLLTRLEEEGLVKAVGRGRTLSERGREVLEALGAVLETRRCSIQGLAGFEECVEAAFPYSPPTELTQVYEVRDLLVSRGCRTSLIGFWREGDAGFPGMPPEILSLVRGAVQFPQAGEGVILVVPSRCEPQLVGALAELALRACGA